MYGIKLIILIIISRKERIKYTLTSDYGKVTPLYRIFHLWKRNISSGIRWKLEETTINKQVNFYYFFNV